MNIIVWVTINFFFPYKYFTENNDAADITIGISNFSMKVAYYLRGEGVHGVWNLPIDPLIPI